MSVNERRPLDANTDFGVRIFLLLYNPELHFGSFVGQVVQNAWVLDQLQAASLDLHGVELLALEEVFQEFERPPRVDSVATSEEVSGTIPKLGPGVDAQVTLLNNHHRRHAVWLEEVAVRA